VPEASGGENTYGNAIALCFDCHADAGHYNPSHPRGTKFSPAELSKAKNNWFDMVAKNNIQQPQEPDHFYCRYYLCKNYEQLVEITNGDLSRFPVENPLLVKNDVIDSLNKIIRNHPYSYRHANAWGKSLSSKAEYLELYPNAIVPDPADGQFSYFEIIRTPSRKELEKLSTQDGLLKIMLEENLPVREIAMVGGYYDGCGGVPLQEEYIFRNLWCAFLAVTNMSNRPVQLNSIRGNLLTGFEFQPLTLSDTETQEFPLPKAPVQPNATVLVPFATILPPFYPVNSQNWSQTYDGESHVQEVSHEGVASVSFEDYLIYRNQLIINSIVYEFDGQILEQVLHVFDLGNMYTIDRSWACGSCPHLFFVGDVVSYSREILAHCDSKVGIDYFKVPKDRTAMVIAEIEDELTEIVSLSINGKKYLQNVSLKKNQFIEIPVMPGSRIEVVGQYLPEVAAKQKFLYGVKRNELVSKFLRTTNQGSTNAYTPVI